MVSQIGRAFPLTGLDLPVDRPSRAAEMVSHGSRRGQAWIVIYQPRRDNTPFFCKAFQSAQNIVRTIAQVRALTRMSRLSANQLAFLFPLLTCARHLRACQKRELR